jgi:hypothetical protein
MPLFFQLLLNIFTLLLYVQCSVTERVPHSLFPRNTHGETKPDVHISLGWKLGIKDENLAITAGIHKLLINIVAADKRLLYCKEKM